MVRGWSIGVGFIEGVGETYAFDRVLFDAVNQVGLYNPASLQDRRNDVDYVVELVADGAWVVNMAWPGDDQPILGTAEIRRDLLRPLERGVERPRPSDGI